MDPLALVRSKMAAERVEAEVREEYLRPRPDLAQIRIRVAIKSQRRRSERLKRLHLAGGRHARR
jgi:hypothetical protein